MTRLAALALACKQYKNQNILLLFVLIFSFVAYLYYSPKVVFAQDCPTLACDCCQSDCAADPSSAQCSSCQASYKADFAAGCCAAGVQSYCSGGGGGGSCSCQSGYHCDSCGTNGICAMCVPDYVPCQNIQCGNDPVTGQSCGNNCSGSDVCLGNSCVAPTAIPTICNDPPASCSGVQCGNVYNSCGDANYCGGCGAGQTCTGNTCCTIQCSGKVCGSNSCGGSCGSCSAGKVCSADQSACVTPSPTPTRVPCTGIQCGIDPFDRITNCGGCPSGNSCILNKCIVTILCFSNAQCQALGCSTCSFGSCTNCTSPSNTPVPTACPWSGCGTSYCGVVTDACGTSHDCSGNSCTAPQVCSSPYCVTPSPTFAPWTKLKDSSFQSAKDLSVTIPANPVAFDSSDSGSSHFIEGTGLVSNSASSLAANQDAASGWQAPGYTPSIIFTKDRLLSYVNSKKEHTNISQISVNWSEVTQSGIYYLNGGTPPEYTITTAPAVDFPFVLIADGPVTIKPSGTDFTPKASMAIIAPTITIDPAVTSINAILIANTIDTGTSNNKLKITGNLIAQSSFVNNRTNAASSNRAPSVYISFDPAVYIDLLPYLSIDKYEWNQLQ